MNSRAPIREYMHRAKEARLDVATFPIVIYVLYTLSITCCVYVDAFNFFLNKGLQQYTFGFLLAFCTVVLACHLTRFRFRRHRVHWVFYVYAACVLALVLVKGCFPDTSYDTFNSHLLAQERFMHGFINQCAPGNFQLYGFALPDRMLYLFRALLGYRYGTVFAAPLMWLCMYQISELLHLFVGTRMQDIRERYLHGTWWKTALNVIFREETFALGILLMQEVIMLLGSYYVDLLSIPILLEMLYCICSKSRGVVRSAWETLCFAALAGILFAMKMTNIAYMVPLLAYYILQNKRSITFPLVCACVAVGVLPCLPYVLVNWVDLGNPCFPYFNAIFQSPYFPTINFKDLRWGPQNARELLLWPFYTVFRPNYRQSEIPTQITAVLFCGYAACTGFLGHALVRWRKRAAQDHWALRLVTLFAAFFVLWAATTGYNRYFIIGYLLLAMIACVFTVQYLLRRRTAKLVGAIGFFVALAVQSVVAVHSCLNGREWAWRAVAADGLQQQIQYVGKDKMVTYSVGAQNKAFLQQDYLSGLAYLTNPNVPIYRYDYYLGSLPDVSKTAISEEIESYLDGGTACSAQYFEDLTPDYFEMLNQRGLYAYRIEHFDNPALRGYRREVLVYFQKLADRDNTFQDLPRMTEKLAPSLYWVQAHVLCEASAAAETLRIYAVTSDDVDDLVYEQRLVSDYINPVSFTVDLSEYASSVSLHFACVDEKGEEALGGVYATNPEFDKLLPAEVPADDKLVETLVLQPMHRD